MTIRTPLRTPVLTVGLAAAVGCLLVLGGGGQASAAQAPVGLGTAGAFAVLGGTTVTNTGPSVIDGELGVSPGTSVTGFPPGIVVNGTIHSADAIALQAQQALTTAYNDAAGRSTTATITSDLGGQTLLPGVYTGATLGLTGTLTLDAQGDANAVFVFQTESTLITASASAVLLTPGTNPCSVFWQVASSATLATGSTFVGTVLAQTAITANTNASISGRLLARSAAVTLDSTRVTLPTCTTVTSTASPSTSTSGSPSPSESPSVSEENDGQATAGPSATPFLGAESGVPGSANSGSTLPLTGWSIGMTALLGMLLASAGGLICFATGRPSSR